jgi:transposase
MSYVGLDVSVARTSVCIIDTAGQVVREQSVVSTPEKIAAVIRATGYQIERISFEVGINSA